MSLIPFDDDLFSFPDFFSNQKMLKGFSNSIRVDLIEKDDCFVVLADIPAGVSKSDIKSEFDGGFLSLNVSVKSDCDCPSCKYVMKERFNGQYSRRFFISDKVDRSKIKASYENCVLKIVIPKLPQEQAVDKTICIE